MIKAAFRRFTEAQLNVYYRLHNGYQIRVMVGNSYFLYDPKRQHWSKRIGPKSFSALNDAGLLKEVESGECFKTYALDDCEALDVPDKCGLGFSAKFIHVPSAFGVVSVEAWKRWNDMGGSP